MTEKDKVYHEALNEIDLMEGILDDEIEKNEVETKKSTKHYC